MLELNLSWCESVQRLQRYGSRKIRTDSRTHEWMGRHRLFYSPPPGFLQNRRGTITIFLRGPTHYFNADMDTILLFQEPEKARGNIQYLCLLTFTPGVEQHDQLIIKLLTVEMTNSINVHDCLNIDAVSSNDSICRWSDHCIHSVFCLTQILKAVQIV